MELFTLEVRYRVSSHLFEIDCLTEEQFHRDIDWVTSDEIVSIVSEKEYDIGLVDELRNTFPLFTWHQYAELYGLK
jgi:hypothetical protein